MGPPESRIAAPGQASGVLDALRPPDRLRFALSFDSCVVSPRGCAASGAQGALLATPWTGQDRRACGLPALVPWSVLADVVGAKNKEDKR